MDRDALILSIVIVSAVALFVTAHIGWLLVLFLASMAGGWRFAKRVTTPEVHGA